LYTIFIFFDLLQIPKQQKKAFTHIERGNSIMEDLSQILSHLSLQDQVSLIVGILSLLTALVSTFSQPGTVRHDLHIVTRRITHPLEPLEKNNQFSLGDVARYFLLLIALFCIAFFLLSVRIEVSSPQSPKDQAIALVQQFYTDINQKDYQTAYALTKDGFQQSYAQFAQGFKDTLHDDISFESVEELPDKTIRVVITIKATENRPEGKRISTYHVAYIIGKQQDTYKILKGTSV
jgi:hypothetical protein